jgi:hypothetical protein
VASVVRFLGARNAEFAGGVRRVRRDTPYWRKLVPRASCPRGPGGDRTALSEGFRPRRHRRPTNSYLVGLHLCCGPLTCRDAALPASWPRFPGTATDDPLTTPSSGSPTAPPRRRLGRRQQVAVRVGGDGDAGVPQPLGHDRQRGSRIHESDRGRCVSQVMHPHRRQPGRLHHPAEVVADVARLVTRPVLPVCGSSGEPR